VSSTFPFRSLLALAIFTSAIPIVGRETSGDAAWRYHASRATQALAQAGRTTLDLASGSTEVPELRFSDFFSSVAGDRGLELSTRLRTLDGRRVQIAGYMAREQHRSEGMFLLTPWPTQVSNDGFCLIDDLPPATLPVLVADYRAVGRIPYRPGRLVLIGVLEVGHAVTPDGRNSFARLRLDEVSSAPGSATASP
jgi:hypothetical protein